MNMKENNMILQMRVNELEKEALKLKKDISVLTNDNETLKADNLVITKALRSTEERLRIELFVKFGSKSEKYRKLFKIPEAYYSLDDLKENLSEEEKTILSDGEKVVKRIKEEEDSKVLALVKKPRNRNPKSRKRGNSNGKQKFDASYSREERIIDIPNKECQQCGVSLISLNTYCEHEYIDLLEKSLQIIREKKPKYYCPNCGVSKNDETGEKNLNILCAPSPKNRFIPGGLAGNNLIATALCDKYFYGLSSYRLSSRFKNFGIDISDQNLSNWFIKAAEELTPLADEILKDILSGSAINSDETTYKVLDEEERKDTSKSWLWVLCSSDKKEPKVYFKYDPSRSSDVFKNLVGDYDGYVQADCYIGYQAKKQDYKFKLALCTAHLRRKFTDALKGGNYQEGSPGYITIDKILKVIGKIYEIDKTERVLFDKGIATEEEFVQKRKKLSSPQFKKLTKVINGRKDFHTNDDNILNGMNYYLKHVELFPKYLEIAALNPDNSLAERIIKGFSRIRMNTLFAGSPRGAKAMATLETIIHSANLNDMDIKKYMKYLLENVSLMRDSLASEANYKRLLPWNMSEETKDKLSIQTMSIKHKKF